MIAVTTVMAAAAPRVGGPGFAVVELFTSEGCSSCPPADEALLRLAAVAARDGLPVYTLEWHVDYWDYLGWKDPFGSRLASLRQQTYARLLRSTLFTPEAIVNGSLICSWAGDSAELERNVRAAVARPSAAGLELRVRRGPASSSLTVQARTHDPPGGSQVLVALIEEGLGARPTAGENAGRQLRHSGVVRAFAMLSSSGGEAVLSVPPGTDPLRAFVVGLLQEHTLRVAAAARADLPSAGASLDGRVTDGQGRAWAGAIVQACNGNVCVPAVTDSTGAFHFDELSPGNWSIVAGPSAGAVEVHLDAGQVLQLREALVASR